MGLFRAIWQTSDRKKAFEAKQAVKKIGDPSRLRTIALSAPLDEVRLAAAEKISDPQVLKEIVLAATSLDLKAAVAERIGDEAVLRELVDGEDFGLTEYLAVYKFDDRELLRRIVFGGHENVWKQVLLKAVDSFGDRRELQALIDRHGADAEVRRSAVIAQWALDGAKALRCAEGEQEILLQIYYEADEIRSQTVCYLFLDNGGRGVRQRVPQQALQSCGIEPLPEQDTWERVPFCPCCGGVLAWERPLELQSLYACRCDRRARKLPLMVRVVR